MWAIRPHYIGPCTHGHGLLSQGCRHLDETLRNPRHHGAAVEDLTCEKENIMKKLLLSSAAGVATSTAVFAMAATLGGITSTGLGADTTVVASCDTDGVSVAYTTTWDAPNAIYEVTTVTVSGLNATCDGKAISVSLTNAAGDVSVTGTETLDLSNSATSDAVTVAAIDAEVVSDTAIVITG